MFNQENNNNNKKLISKGLFMTVSQLMMDGSMKERQWLKACSRFLYFRKSKDRFIDSLHGGEKFDTDIKGKKTEQLQEMAFIIPYERYRHILKHISMQRAQRTLKIECERVKNPFCQWLIAKYKENIGFHFAWIYSVFYLQSCVDPLEGDIELQRKRWESEK